MLLAMVASCVIGESYYKRLTQARSVLRSRDTDSVFNGRALVQDVEHHGLFGMEAMVDVMISNEGKRCSRRRAYKSDI